LYVYRDIIKRYSRIFSGHLFIESPCAGLKSDSLIVELAMLASAPCYFIDPFFQGSNHIAYTITKFLGYLGEGKSETSMS